MGSMNTRTYGRTRVQKAQMTAHAGLPDPCMADPVTQNAPIRAAVIADKCTKEETRFSSIAPCPCNPLCLCVPSMCVHEFVEPPCPCAIKSFAYKHHLSGACIVSQMPAPNQHSGMGTPKHTGTVARDARSIGDSPCVSRRLASSSPLDCPCVSESPAGVLSRVGTATSKEEMQCGSVMHRRHTQQHRPDIYTFQWSPSPILCKLGCLV